MSLCNIKLLVFIADTKRIYSAVRMESLNIMQVKVLITMLYVIRSPRRIPEIENGDACDSFVHCFVAA